MKLTPEQRTTAESRMQAIRQAGHVQSARYDAGSDRIIISLNTGLDLVFPPSLAEGLAGTDTSALSVIEISPSGLGLHWPALDADLYVPGLLQGQFGSRQWLAAELGGQGGRSRSVAKTEAARANGRKGGRPRKSVLA